MFIVVVIEGVAHQLHGLIGVEAVLPAHGDVVVAECVGRDHGAELVPGVVLFKLAVIGGGGGQAGGGHQVDPDSVRAELRQGLV